MLWPEPAPTPWSGHPKWAVSQKTSAGTVTARPNQRMWKIANWKLEMLLKPWGLVRPAQHPVTASDIPQALAFWEDAVGHAPHLPAIPVEKRAAKDAAPIHLLRVKSPALCFLPGDRGL